MHLIFNAGRFSKPLGCGLFYVFSTHWQELFFRFATPPGVLFPYRLSVVASFDSFRVAPIEAELAGCKDDRAALGDIIRNREPLPAK